MFGRAVLVTGCNRGIGLEFVKQILSLPNPPEHVFAACRTPGKAEELNGLASDSQISQVHLLPFDASRPDEVPELASQVKSVVGDEGLNVLINNAGIMHKDSFRGVTTDKLNESFAVNAVTPLMLIKNLYPLLKQASKQHSGKDMSISRAAVVNISAILGSIHTIGVGHVGRTYSYSLSKAALNMATVSAAQDMKRDSILSVSLHPGWVATDLGGAKAPVKVDESVRAMLGILQGLGTKNTGQFYDHTGKEIAW